jgi:hypothetical protein
MNERYPNIRQRDDEGHVWLREGIVICFFMHRSHGAVAPAVWRAVETYRRAIPPGALAWYPDPEGEWQPLDEEGWEHERRKMLERPWPQDCNVELVQSCSREKRPYGFEYHGRWLDAPWRRPDDGATCAAAFSLPTEYLLEHGPGRVRELALELSRELPFSFGYASLALLFSHWHMGTLRPLLTRYMGLDLPRLQTTSRIIGTRARGAFWLTFLGQPLLGELGGLEHLRQALPFPEVSFLPLEGQRALLTLGEWPELIDTAQPAPVPLHLRSLARLLEPFMYEEQSSGFYLHTESMNRWLRRLCSSSPS